MSKHGDGGEGEGEGEGSRRGAQDAPWNSSARRAQWEHHGAVKATKVGLASASTSAAKEAASAGTTAAVRAAARMAHTASTATDGSRMQPRRGQRVVVRGWWWWWWVSAVPRPTSRAGHSRRSCTSRAAGVRITWRRRAACAGPRATLAQAAQRAENETKLCAGGRRQATQTRHDPHGPLDTTRPHDTNDTRTPARTSSDGPGRERGPGAELLVLSAGRPAAPARRV